MSYDKKCATQNLQKIDLGGGHDGTQKKSGEIGAAISTAWDPINSRKSQISARIDSAHERDRLTPRVSQLNLPGGNRWHPIVDRLSWRVLPFGLMRQAGRPIWKSSGALAPNSSSPYPPGRGTGSFRVACSGTGSTGPTAAAPGPQERVEPPAPYPPARQPLKPLLGPPRPLQGLLILMPGSLWWRRRRSRMRRRRPLRPGKS